MQKNGVGGRGGGGQSGGSEPRVIICYCENAKLSGECLGVGKGGGGSVVWMVGWMDGCKSRVIEVLKKKKN